MYVIGHGILARTIANVRKAVVDYFSLPLARKLENRITCDNYRGYIPLNFFSPAGEATPADHYEGFKLHFEVAADDPVCAQCDLYGPNRWPDVADFRESLLSYWRECDRVANTLLSALGESLDIAVSEFLQMFEQPLSNMTLLHYPPQQTDTGFGIHPHKDTDALTILVPDPVGGLMVKRRDSDGWIHAEPYGDALLVNIGDLLELWSGGYFVSTPHKVVNISGAERYSFPYFAVPRFDTIVAPLRKPLAGFQRDAVPVGDVSREVWRSNWPDIVPQHPEFDLGTLND